MNAKYDQIIDFVAAAKKAIAAAVGVAALLLAQGVLSGDAQQWAQFAVALGTVLGVYRTTNGRKPKPCAALDESDGSDAI